MRISISNSRLPPYLSLLTFIMTAFEGSRAAEPAVLLPKQVAENFEHSSRNLAPIPPASILKVEQKQPYTVLEEPNRVGEKIKVITIGAGASALNFAHDIDTNSLDIELTMYEKNPEIGGTWFENRYPGCACDIPSVVYQLSWAPSAEWGS
jgi:hypothetical protein